MNRSTHAICDQHPARLPEEPHGLSILAGVGLDIQAGNKVNLCIVFDGAEPAR